MRVSHGHFRPLAALLLAACQPSAAQSPTDAALGSCEANKQELVALLERLPERALLSAIEVPLPEAALGGGLGQGPVLEIAAHITRLNGEPIPGASEAERIAKLGERLNDPSSQAKTVYVAAAAETDVRSLRRYLRAVPQTFELRLLFVAPLVPIESEAERGGYELAHRILAERDPARRRALAQQGYQEFSSCAELDHAVASARELPDPERWPKLKSGMLTALGSCSCDSVDAANLEHLVAAEQRAGSMAFGSLPLSFMRDERCGASMPLRSMQKLLRQIEDFDAEFSGNFQEDAIAFEKVVSDERLLNYFCDALPGETLAELQRARATVYWRVPEQAACQAWTFEPLSPGAPMGTWKRGGPEPLELHYWQGAEQIRLFGPAETKSKPTDKRSWVCDQNLSMVGIDAGSIALEQGRWYFSEAACEQAPAEQAALPGCVGRLAAGASASASAETAEGEAGPATTQP